jgi:hypothetical protein
MVKTFPLKLPEVSTIVPPLASTAHFAMESPRPFQPASRDREESILKNLSKTFDRKDSSMVLPWSCTAISMNGASC